jgi:hypothetical protein
MGEFCTFYIVVQVRLLTTTIYGDGKGKQIPQE